MRFIQAICAAPLLVLGMAGTADAQVGKNLPEVELEDFGNTAATEFADFSGRTVLIEFFAYW